MHDVHPEVVAHATSLLGCEGWPLLVTLLEDSAKVQVETIRHSAPLGPDAQAAAVKLAHIEELRDMFRSILPADIGDPFDVAQRPSYTGLGQRSGPEPEPPEDDDPYQL